MTRACYGNYEVQQRYLPRKRQLTFRTAKEAARLFTAKPFTPADIAAAAIAIAENFIVIIRIDINLCDEY